jgi:uncharacterized phage-like protein YoqJ
MSIVAATGHRPNKLDNDYFNVTPLTKAIYDEMVRYCNSDGVTEAISRMALGADQLWAGVALDLHIPLTCIIPFRGQELVWSKHSQRLYHEILSKATKVIYVHDEPAPAEKWRVYSWLEDGNEYMIDYSQKLIAVHDGSVGGTYNALTYAKKTKPGMPIYIINPNVIRARLAKKPIE